MVELVNLVIIFFPVIPVILLLLSMNHNLRRFWLLILPFTIFMLFVWSYVINWAWHYSLSAGAPFSPFEGAAAPFLYFFFSSLWPPAVYALLLAVAGYFANRVAARRIERRARQSTKRTGFAEKLNL